MNKFLIFGVAVLVFAGLPQLVLAQARRTQPPPSAAKSNKRPDAVATPTPSPTPEEEAISSDISDSGEVISVDTKLVSIPVRIIDRKGRFVGGLTKENFKVTEDGKDQEIGYFTNEAQPFTVALVLDMSYSTTFKIAEIQAAAITFIDQLRPADKVMVISFDEEVNVLCDATSDRQKIYQAIKGTKIATGTSLYEAVDLTMNEKLRSISGRKAIVLFTDGVDTTSRTSYDRENISDAAELDALIYPIRYDTFADVQRMKNKPGIGLPAPGPTLPPTGQEKTPFPFPIPTSGMGTPSSKGTEAEDYRKAEEYLDQLAVKTGGRMYVASTFDNLTGAFAKIASELREFYSLGYYPTEESSPGKIRRIKVRVDRENVSVRARDSYVVGKAAEKRK